MRHLSHLATALLALATLAPLTGQSKGKVDFQRQILPILEKNCVECHRATYVDENGKRRRPKGRVMLDTLANIEKSKRGKLFVSGKPDDSYVIESITLPADDEDRMPPPKQGPPLSKQQVELIRSWIEQGCDYGKWTGEAAGTKPTSKPRAASTGRGKSPKRRGPKPIVTLAKGLRPVPAAALAAFENGPFRVQSVGDDSPLLQVTCCGHTDEVDDRAVATLLPIADHVFELDLARSQAGDGACETIARMPRLTRLDLRESKVSNAGIKQLTACKELRHLNLFATEVSDYAMVAVAELKQLEKLYVWQTEVSAKAVVRLREQLPELDVVFSPALPEPMEEGAGNNRRRR